MNRIEFPGCEADSDSDSGPLYIPPYSASLCLRIRVVALQVSAIRSGLCSFVRSLEGHNIWHPACFPQQIDDEIRQDHPYILPIDHRRRQPRCHRRRSLSADIRGGIEAIKEIKTALLSAPDLLEVSTIIVHMSCHIGKTIFILFLFLRRRKIKPSLDSPYTVYSQWCGISSFKHKTVKWTNLIGQGKIDCPLAKLRCGRSVSGSKAILNAHLRKPCQTIQRPLRYR